MAILDLLHFHVNFRTSSSISITPATGEAGGNPSRVSEKDPVDSGGRFGESCLRLPLHECGVSRHLSKSSLTPTCRSVQCVQVHLLKHV